MEMVIAPSGPLIKVSKLRLEAYAASKRSSRSKSCRGTHHCAYLWLMGINKFTVDLAQVWLLTLTY